MIPYVKIPCSACQRNLRVRTEFIGKQIRCNHCGHSFPVREGDYQIRYSHSSPAAIAERTATLASRLAGPHVAVLEPQTQSRIVDLENQVQDLQRQLDQAHESQQQAVHLRFDLDDAQAERDRLRLQVRTLQEHAAGRERLEAELQTGRAEQDRLQGELHSVQAQLASGLAEIERLRRLSEELEGVRAERDRLDAERQAEKTAAEQLQARVSELEDSLATAHTAHETTYGDLTVTLEKARTEWDAERRALQAQWDQERQAQVHEAEHRLNELQTRAEAERQQMHEQLDTARRQDEQDRAALQETIEQLRQERDQLLTQCDDSTATRQEKEQQARDEIARLNHELIQSHRQEEAAAQSRHELAEQLQTLRVDLDRQRGRDAENQKSLDKLRQDLEVARNELRTEHEQAGLALAEVKTSAGADRSQLEKERASLQESIERYRQDAAASLRERDFHLRQLHALRQEYDRLTVQRQESLDSKGRQSSAPSEVSLLDQAFAESEQEDAPAKDDDKLTMIEQGLEAALIELTAERDRAISAVAEVQAGAATDRQQGEQQVEALQRQLAQERASLREEIARLRQEADALRKERDALRRPAKSGK